MKFIYPVGDYQQKIEKDKPNGYAGLDSSGNIKLNEIVIWLFGVI